MRTAWVFAFIVGLALLASGCLGSPEAGANMTQIHSSAPGSTPGMSQILNTTDNTNNPASKPTAPAVSAPNTTTASGTDGTDKIGTVQPANGNGSAPASAPVIDPKKALKISMLRVADTLEVGTSRIKLEKIYLQDGLVARYALFASDGSVKQEFELNQNESFTFSTADGTEYIVVAVFTIGEGMPNGVQTQVYRSSDLTRSTLDSTIGQPTGSFALSLEFPSPVIVANATVGLGQTLMATEIGAQPVQIDRSSSVPAVSLLIVDHANQKMGSVILQGGQMVDVRMPTGERYSVVLVSVPTDGQQVSLAIYHTQAFRPQAVNGSNGTIGRD